MQAARWVGGPRAPGTRVPAAHPAPSRSRQLDVPGPYSARGLRRSQMGYLISTAMELVRDLLEPVIRWTAFAIFVAGLLLGRLSKRRQDRPARCTSRAYAGC